MSNPTTSSTMEDLFKGLGINIDEEILTSADVKDGIVSDYSVQNANKKLSPIKTDYGVSQVLLYPFWMKLGFHPVTLDKLPKGSSINSYKLNLTPAQLIGMLKDACTPTKAELKDPEIVAKKAEYKTKLYSLLRIKDDKFEIVCDGVTGVCTPETFEVFSDMFNMYNVQALTQRYKVSAEKTITRAAVFECLPNGNIDADKSDQVLINSFACETALLASEVTQYEKEENERGTIKKTIETGVGTIRRDRIISRPFVTSVVACFAIKSSTSSIIEEDEITRLSSDSFDFKYTMGYDKTNEGLLAKLASLKERSRFFNVNYLPIQRNVPQKDDKVPNIGVAIQLTEYVTVNEKKPVATQLPCLDAKIAEALVSNDFLDPENFKMNVSKFSPISVEEARKCYSNNISQYIRALKDPVTLQANQQYLSEISIGFGKDYVTKQTAIDVEFTDVAATVEDKSQDVVEATLDTEDLEALGNTSSNVKAEDFV